MFLWYFTMLIINVYFVSLLNIVLLSMASRYSSNVPCFISILLGSIFLYPFSVFNIYWYDLMTNQHQLKSEMLTLHFL